MLRHLLILISINSVEARRFRTRSDIHARSHASHGISDAIYNVDDNNVSIECRARDRFIFEDTFASISSENLCVCARDERFDLDSIVIYRERSARSTTIDRHT